MGGSVKIVTKNFRKVKIIEKDVENYFEIFFVRKVFMHSQNKIENAHFFMFLLQKNFVAVFEFWK